MDNLGAVLKDSKLFRELLTELTSRRNSSSLSSEVRNILLDFDAEKFHDWIKRQTLPFMSNRVQNLTQDNVSNHVSVHRKSEQADSTASTAPTLESVPSKQEEKRGKYLDILMKSNGNGETSQGFGSAVSSSSQDTTNGTTTTVNTINTVTVKPKKKAALSTKVKKRVAPTTITPVTTAGMEIDGTVVTGNILTLPDSDVSTMRECLSDANSISSTPPSSVNVSIDFGNTSTSMSMNGSMNGRRNMNDTSMESGVSMSSTMTVGGSKEQQELILVPLYSKKEKEKDSGNTSNGSDKGGHQDKESKEGDASSSTNTTSDSITTEGQQGDADPAADMSRRVYEHEDAHAVQRLSRLYAGSVQQQGIAIVDALTLLSRLICISRPVRGTTVALLSIANPNHNNKRSKKKSSSNSNTSGEKPLLVTLHMVHIFAAKALEYLEQYVKLLGGHFLDALSDCSVLRDYHPTLARAFQSIAVDLRGNDDHFTLPDVFIRPFREEIDSRLEYKTAAESQIYNEREKCFDEFSNLFHSYQEANRSDISGVKVSAVYRSIPTRGAKVLNLKDCNIHWFADLFVKMLLFYGSNATTNKKTSPTGTSSSNGNNSTHTSSGNSNASTRNEGSKEASSVVSYEKNGTVYYSNPKSGASGANTRGKSMYTASSTIKQRKLEERLGVGGHTSVGGYRGGNAYNSKSTASNGSETDLFEEPALYFPGAQQFFFRFIVMLDSHRFTECLESVLCAEIVTLVDGSSSRNGMSGGRRNSKTGGSSGMGGMTTMTGNGTTNTNTVNDGDTSDDDSNITIMPSTIGTTSASLSESFSQRTLKLKMLGKFLGLVKFWPHWTLSMGPMGGLKGAMGGNVNNKNNSKGSGGVSSNSVTGSKPVAGPVSLLIEEGAVNRMMMKTSLPIQALLEKAWTVGNTMLVAAWTTEFLKMSRWDSAVAKYNSYEDALYTLKLIQHSSLFHPTTGMLTSNRLHTLLDIQSLWYMLPSPVVRKVMDSNSTSNDTNAIKLPGMGGSNGGTSAGIRLDDLNQAFTPTFNHYVAPFLEEIITSMRLKGKSQRRAQAGPVSRASAMNESSRTGSNAGTGSDGKQGEGGVDGAGRSRAGSKINRVTPTVVSNTEALILQKKSSGGAGGGGQKAGGAITVSESSSFHSIASSAASSGGSNGVTTIGFGTGSSNHDSSSTSNGMLLHRRSPVGDGSNGSTSNGSSSTNLGDLSMSIQHDLTKKVKQKGDSTRGGDSQGAMGEGESGRENSVNTTLTSTSLQLNQIQQQLRFGSPTHPPPISPRTSRSPIEGVRAPPGPPGLRPLTPLGRAMSIVTTHSNHKNTGYAPGSLSSTTSTGSLGNKSFFSLERSSSGGLGGSSDSLRERQFSSVSPLSFSHGRSGSHGRGMEYDSREGGSGKIGMGGEGVFEGSDDFANRWSWVHDQGSNDPSPIKAPLPSRRESEDTDDGRDGREGGGKDVNEGERELEMRRKYSLSPTAMVEASSSEGAERAERAERDAYTLPPSSLTAIKDELETAFWQQHPQLLYMGSFIIEHCHVACHAHLKDRVGAAVRQYFDVASSIRERLDEGLDGKIEEMQGSHGRTQGAMGDSTKSPNGRVNKTSSSNHLAAFVGQLSSSQETRFREEMLIAMNRLHTTTITEGAIFVRSFLPQKLGRDTLSKMCSMYPGHERIQHVAIQLIQKQSLQQSYVLVDFLNAYTKRKLRDVMDLSVQQYKKYSKDMCVFKARQSLSPLSTGSTGSVTASGAGGEKADLGQQLEEGTGGSAIVPSSPLPGVLPSYERTLGRIQHSLSSLASYFIYTAQESEGAMGEKVGMVPLSNTIAMQLFCRGSIGHTIALLEGRRGQEGDLMEYSYGCRGYRVYAAQLSYDMEQMVGLLAVMGAIVTQPTKDGDDSEKERRATFLQCITSFLQLQSAHLRWDTMQREQLGQEGGRFKIETAKHMILTLPSLLYLDILRVDILERESSSSSSSSGRLPSDFLLSVYANGGLRRASLIRCILSTARKATLGYYTSCVGYHQLRGGANKALLSLLYRCINWSSGDGDGGKKDNKGNEKDAVESWSTGSEAKGQIKAYFGSELDSLFSKLIFNTNTM